MAHPLEGLRVLDLSRVLSGPSCAKALVDLGAEVIKLEPPEGDLTRTAQPRVGGVPVYFAQQNCGKRCISVDLRDRRGQSLALDLASRCDVLVENFRPGVLDRLGLGWARTSERNPRLIHCSISGYGSGGPSSTRRAYAPVIHAELGYMELVARRTGHDVRAEAVSHADLHSGSQAVIGILAALWQRERTGLGQHVEVSMAEVMLQATEWTAVELAGGEGGRFHVFGGANAPILRLGDGTRVSVPGDPAVNFAAWCRAMRRPDLASDARFATVEDRARRRAELEAELQRFADGMASFEEFEAALGSERIACGRIRTLSEAVRDPWSAGRAALVDVSQTDEELLLPRSPFRFSDAAAGTRGVPAWQGQHNREVLRELGYDEALVTQLEDDGVLVERPPGQERRDHERPV